MPAVRSLFWSAFDCALDIAEYSVNLSCAGPETLGSDCSGV